MSRDDPHYHGHRQRLRERFLRAGFDGFNDHEIVELLLTLAIPRSDLKQPAKALIARFGNLRAILDAPLEELQEIKGIGSVAPVALRIIRAAAALYLQQSAEGEESLADPDRLSSFWRMRIGALRDRSSRWVTSTRVTACSATASSGWRKGRSIGPQCIPAESWCALKRGAVGLVLAHNHPNGHVQPSEQDKILTRALVLAAETVHLKIIDHLIVSADHVFSFRKAGLL